MNQLLSRRVSVLFYVVVLMFFVRSVGYSQDTIHIDTLTTSITQHIQGNVFALRITGGGDTLAMGSISQAYTFNTYDDSAASDYVVTEIKKNGVRLDLYDYVLHRTINYKTDSSLSTISRTNSFSVFTGDTISFYREFSWFNHLDGNVKKLDNYYSHDTLIYTIELIEDGTNNRLALLDSMGVYPQMPAGIPSYFGYGPVMVLRQYIVPSSRDDKDVLIRINIHVSGSGSYDPVRYETVTHALSGRLVSPYFSAYRNIYNQSF
ncbi:MAG: hypothetical protein AB7H80_13535 [Candidatus Kapaibacterium sp.]